MNKIWDSFDKAVADISDGATIMIGGAQGPIGTPRNLIMALNRKGTKNITLVTTTGYRVKGQAKAYGFPHSEDWVDHSLLIDSGQVKKVLCSMAYIAGRGGNLQKLYESGEVELEHVGHGAFTARIWAGGAGIGGIYNPVGIGTIQEEGQEVRVIDGKPYILQKPIKADFALISAYKADRYGNLIYFGTGRQYGPLMCRAAKTTIVEVDEIVEPGELDPEAIITPGVYVHRILRVPEEDKR
jgi:3-oxoacid CoA-transferase A subunit